MEKDGKFQENEKGHLELRLTSETRSRNWQPWKYSEYDQS